MLCKQLRSSAFLFLGVLALTVGCGTNELKNSQTQCEPDETFNRVSGTCEPRPGLDAGEDVADASSADAGADADAELPEDTGDDAAPDAGPDPDARPDAEHDAEPDVDPQCPDGDGDGFFAQECGGQDCDDGNATVFPGAPETCSQHDNDCDGQRNQGIDCTFYGHSSSQMYLVDPFEKTATAVTGVPGLFDIDTHPDGTLYGITSSNLYKFNPSNSTWTIIGSLGVSGNPNGLAIDNQGTAYITASREVYTVNLQTGQASLVGPMGGSFNSSGDCVVNKDNSLYMSSNHDFNGDTLVLIDGNTGQASEIGSIGESSVYGLTAAWGRMYGLTGGGKLIEINTGTGQSTEIHQFSGISWYGAASTPGR